MRSPSRDGDDRERDAGRAVATVQRLDLPEARPVGRNSGRGQQRAADILFFADGRDRLFRGDEGADGRLGRRSALVLAEAHGADEARGRVGDDADLAFQRAGKDVAVARLQQEPGGKGDEGHGHRREMRRLWRRVAQLQEADPDEAKDGRKDIGGDRGADGRRKPGAKARWAKRKTKTRPAPLTRPRSQEPARRSALSDGTGARLPAKSRPRPASSSTDRLATATPRRRAP